MKKVILVVQGRAETGKSILTFMLGEKYREAIIVDMDTLNKTTCKQLAYRNPLQLTFLDSTGFPDHNLFDRFFKDVHLSSHDLFICDLGSECSKYLPDLIEDDLSLGSSIIKSLDIELVICVVVAGHYLFPACMNYLQQITEKANGEFKIKAVRNEFFTYNLELNTALRSYCDDNNIEVITLVSLVDMLITPNN